MYIALILVLAAATFGLCYLLDKGFQKLFRGKRQHRSGLSVRLNKMYSIAGVVLTFLGICSLLSGAAERGALLYGGIVVLVLGIGLCVYHLSFGVFYDRDTFLFTRFGKKDLTYRYEDIRCQKLYVITGGSLVVELHLEDGNTVSLQSTMNGVYPFLDTAFHGWCRQKGIDPAGCTFHDPENHLWFPAGEDT